MKPEKTKLYPKISAEWARQIAYMRWGLEQIKEAEVYSTDHVFYVTCVLPSIEFHYADRYDASSAIAVEHITTACEKVWDPINNEVHLIGYEPKTNVIGIYQEA